MVLFYLGNKFVPGLYRKQMFRALVYHVGPLKRVDADAEVSLEPDLA